MVMSAVKLCDTTAGIRRLMIYCLYNIRIISEKTWRLFTSLISYFLPEHCSFGIILYVCLGLPLCICHIFCTYKFWLKRDESLIQVLFTALTHYYNTFLYFSVLKTNYKQSIIFIQSLALNKRTHKQLSECFVLRIK